MIEEDSSQKKIPSMESDMFESKQLLIDGTILFQDLKDDTNIKLIEESFEHLFNETLLKNEDPFQLQQENNIVISKQ